MFAAAMERVGDSLMALTSAMLSDGSVWPRQAMPGQPLCDFARRVCDTVASFAQEHMSVFATDAKRGALLEHLMAFTQHEDLGMSGLTLTAWGNLLRPDNLKMIPGKKNAQGQGLAPSTSPAGPAVAPGTLKLPREAMLSLLKLSLMRLWQLASTKEDPEDFPDEYDTFGDWKEFLSIYKNNTTSIVKWITLQLPQEGLTAAMEALEGALQALVQQQQTPEYRRAVMEAAASFTTAVMVSGAWQMHRAGGGSSFRRRASGTFAHRSSSIAAVSEESIAPGSPSEAACDRALQLLLSAPVDGQREPQVLVPLVETLSAFGPVIRRRPQAALPVIDRIFGILGSVPIVPEGRGDLPPPASSGSSAEWRDNFLVRQRVAGSLVQVTTSAPQVLAQHLQHIAGKIQEMSDRLQLRIGERNALLESLVGALRDIPDQALHEQVLGWVLQSTRDWMNSQELRQSIATPEVGGPDRISDERGALFRMLPAVSCRPLCSPTCR